MHGKDALSDAEFDEFLMEKLRKQFIKIQKLQLNILQAFQLTFAH